MQSWKARILMLLTTMAMVLAMSMPVVAQADSCDPWDKDCDPRDDTSDSCDPWDKDCDPRSDRCDSWDEECDPWDDNGDNADYEVFPVGNGAWCFVTYNEDDTVNDLVCLDENGNVVWED